MMGSYNYSDEHLYTAVSSGMAQIQFTWAQIQTVLASSELFDAELSMQAAEAMREFANKSSVLLRDSLHKLGYTDEQIDDAILMLKKALGLE